jgi:Zn-dependent protease with chaperone function
MRRLLTAVFLFAGLTACAPLPEPASPPGPGVLPSATARQEAETAVRRFVEVVETVEPVAERECRARTLQAECDFLIVVDDRPGQPPNAFQTRDRSGRPVIAFTVPLIAEVQNADELAFVMAHEAAHHLLGHIDRQRRDARTGALVFGQLASMTGGGADVVRSAQELGAIVGARSYSKDYELEADALGTILTMRAGYDPLRGAAGTGPARRCGPVSSRSARP